MSEMLEHPLNPALGREMPPIQAPRSGSATNQGTPAATFRGTWSSDFAGLRCHPLPSIGARRQVRSFSATLVTANSASRSARVVAVMPRRSTIQRIVFGVGSRRPCSIALTVGRDTPRATAMSDCVSPFALRAAMSAHLARVGDAEFCAWWAGVLT